MSSTRDIAVAVYGSTGYTGRLVCEYLRDTYGSGGAWTWAIAGRSESKLLALKTELALADDVPVVVADSSDPASLAAMAARCTVVLTTVGPYFKYGSALVAACAAAGTHYVDLTGEAFWIRDMIDAHHAEAARTGAKIVPSCGFDSVPSDLGFVMMGEAMRERHGCECASIDYFAGDMSGGPSGGTLDTMVTLFSHPGLVKRMVTQPYMLNPTSRGAPPAPAREPMFVGYERALRQWTAPFVMAGHNTKVVRRTHALLGFRFGERCTYTERMALGGGLPGLAAATGTALALPVFGLLMFVGLFRRLLQWLLPPGAGPTRKQRDNGHFTTHLVARGAGGQLLQGIVQEQHGDPGYKCTAKMLTESALSLALEQARLPDVGGGVLTPGYALGEVLAGRLRAAGMRVEVLE